MIDIWREKKLFYWILQNAPSNVTKSVENRRSNNNADGTLAGAGDGNAGERGRSYCTRVRVKPRQSCATWRVLAVYVIYVRTSIQKIRDNLDVGRNANRSRARLFNRSWTRSRRGNSCFSR